MNRKEGFIRVKAETDEFLQGVQLQLSSLQM